MANPGGYYCPHCKEFNACDCKVCAKVETESRRVKVTDDGEGLACQYCGKDFSPDQSLEVEWEMYLKERNIK